MAAPRVLANPAWPPLAPQGPSFASDFPQTPLLDSFSSSLDPSLWQTPWLDVSSLDVNAGFLEPAGAAGGAAAWIDSFGPDCEVYVSVTVLPPSGSALYLDVRRQTIGAVQSDGYELQVIPSTSTWSLRRVILGSPTSIKTMLQPFVAGDSMGVRVVGDTLTVYYLSSGSSAWVSLGSVVDTSFTNVLGYIGLEGEDTTQVTRWDSFGGGSLSPLIVSALPLSKISSHPFGLALGQRLFPAARMLPNTGNPLSQSAVNSYEANQGIAASDSDPLDATGGIASISSDPLEVLGGIQQTKSDPWDAIIGGIQQTKSEVWEALLGIASTKSDAWEGLQAIAATKSDPWETLLAISKTNSESWEALLGIAKTNAEVWEALQKLAATGLAPLEAIVGGTVASASESWEANLGIAATKSDPYEAPQTIAATKNEAWEAIGAVSSTRVSPWEAIVSGIVSTRLNPWEANFSIASSKIEVWESLLGVASALSDPYDALQMLASTKLGPYEVSQALVLTKSVPYEAIKALAATSLEPWEALRWIAAISSDPWEADGHILVTQTASLPWDALQAIASSASDPLDTNIGGISSTRSGPYEALRVIAATNPEIYESLRTIQALTVSPWDATGIVYIAVSATGELPYDALAEIRTIPLLPLEASRNLTKAASGPLEAQVKVFNSKTFSYETLVGVLNPSRLPLEVVIAAISNLGILPWEATGRAKIITTETGLQLDGTYHSPNFERVVVPIGGTFVIIAVPSELIEGLTETGLDIGET